MIPIIRPVLGDAEAAATAEVLASGWVTQGPRTKAFEEKFAARVGASHACAVSSCTAALHLALLAVGVAPGDRIITTSHSFIATANAIRYCGAIPVFADIEPGTFNLDPARVEALIDQRTRAILVVHQMGMPCDLAALVKIARRHGLALIEDAACAIGSEIRDGEGWETIGKPHGDIACFSFHPRKILTTGDGGMACTANPEWDRRMRALRQHAMSLPDTVRHSAREVMFESYGTLGFNYRLTDIQAAVGCVQLDRLEGILSRRRALADSYREILAAIPGLGLPVQPEWARSNWQSFCVRLPAGRDQKRVMQRMLDGGIATRRGIMCIHQEPAYAKEPWSCAPDSESCACPGEGCRNLPHSEAARDGAIILPLYHDMTAQEQERVADALALACRE